MQSITPYRLRLIAHRAGGELDDKKTRDLCRKYCRNEEVLSTLIEDVRAVRRYREAHTQDGDRIRIEHLRRSLPKARDLNDKLGWLDDDRDFIYTKYGLHVLQNRYLRPNEPIQVCLLRIAHLLCRNHHSCLTTESLEALCRIVYDMLSCGMIHVSSILAAADQATEPILPGEACRLLVAKNTYDHRLVKQLEQISLMISMGVGVGYGASRLPKFGSTEPGKIRSGFRAVARKLNACNFVTLYERKPKIAMYVHVHCDTIYEIMELKIPAKAPLENVFFGLMIPDYFMECVRSDQPWYLFSGNTRLDGHSLDDFYGEDYEREYKRWVERNLYTAKTTAKTVMRDILQSIVVSGSPYIVWMDNVNRYNNQRHLGVVKTLNLCAEITNYSDEDNSSSCMLMSCNMGMYRDFPGVVDAMYRYMRDTMHVPYDCSDFPEVDLARYAHALGYLGTLIMNKFMGPNRRRREIALTPLGVYDMALISELEPNYVSGIVAEALYKGAILSSIDEYRYNGTVCQNFPGSAFSHGQPQWLLRGHLPRSDWTKLTGMMHHGMANSMLVAQAPTATTSLLTGVSESVIIPMNSLVSKESENGRDKCIIYGIMYRSLQNDRLFPIENNSVDAQLAMYTESVPYVDHSQSTMFTLDLDTQAIFDLLVKTYRAKLKTAIYYVLFKQRHPTLNSVRSSDTCDSGCDACQL